jgi:pimeloyl-ACP methyl ester carboxylesterase
MDETLTTESGIDCIRAAVSEASAGGSKKPIVVGGSLGGYLLMDYVGLHPHSIAAAVVCMCGQRVGVGRTSWMAYFGLLAMDAVLPTLSSKTLVEGLVSAIKANRHMDIALVMEGSLRPGMFFGQAAAQIEVLRRSDPAANLPLFPGPVLFFNGSKDHRDHEEVWRSLCTHRLSALKVFEGGDHFFTHDERFREQFLADVIAFIHDVEQQA